ncbi:MAG: AAA family ATPase [Prevotellaceae bacterium]|jgi:AAA15 family ATPase/GTPase|nr:AAA family ATPase [Prevotellaceae bacterium]
MNNMIKYAHITNFKSIRDLRLENCRRINLFIGYPNVGKSNLIEALSLFSLPFLEPGENLNRFIRAENKNELFYNAANKYCFVETNFGKAELVTSTGLIFLLNAANERVEYRFLKELIIDSVDTEPNNLAVLNTVKRYIFQQKKQWKSTGNELLLPPFGENIIDTLSYSNDVADVKKWMKEEFAKCGLEYILDKISNSIKIQRRLDSDEVYQFPYSSIADTLQRIIFYKTAIASNKNSVLLFEEPEAHAFPPYIRTLTYDIEKSASNQFFITTHSPFVINDFLECPQVREELSIYLVGFNDGQTTAKRLSDEEMDEIYNYGEDLFFNIEKFL